MAKIRHSPSGRRTGGQTKNYTLPSGNITSGFIATADVTFDKKNTSDVIGGKLQWDQITEIRLSIKNYLCHTGDTPEFSSVNKLINYRYTLANNNEEEHIWTDEQLSVISPEASSYYTPQYPYWTSDLKLHTGLKRKLLETAMYILYVEIKYPSFYDSHSYYQSKSEDEIQQIVCDSWLEDFNEEDYIQQLLRDAEELEELKIELIPHWQAWKTACKMSNDIGKWVRSVEWLRQFSHQHNFHDFTPYVCGDNGEIPWYILHSLFPTANGDNYFINNYTNEIEGFANEVGIIPPRPFRLIDNGEIITDFFDADLLEKFCQVQNVAFSFDQEVFSLKIDTKSYKNIYYVPSTADINA